MSIQPISLNDLSNTAKKRMIDWKARVTPFYKDHEIESRYNTCKQEVLAAACAISTSIHTSDDLSICLSKAEDAKDLTLRIRTILDIMGVSQEKYLRMVHVLRKRENLKSSGKRPKWVGNIENAWDMARISRNILADRDFSQMISRMLVDPTDVLGNVLPVFISSRMRLPLNTTLAERVAEDRAYTEIRNQIGEHLYRKIKEGLKEKGIFFDRGKYDSVWSNRSKENKEIITNCSDLTNVRDVDFYVPLRTAPKIAIEVQFGETTSQGMRNKAKVIEKDYKILRKNFRELHTFCVLDGIGWEILGDNDIIHLFQASEVFTISEIPMMIEKIHKIVYPHAV